TRSRHGSIPVLSLKGGSPFVESGFCQSEIVVWMSGEPGEIPPIRVRSSHNDDGNTLARSERQLGHRPKETVLIEGIDRPHEPQDSTSHSDIASQSWPPSGR